MMATTVDAGDECSRRFMSPTVTNLTVINCCVLMNYLSHPKIQKLNRRRYFSTQKDLRDKLEKSYWEYTANVSISLYEGFPREIICPRVKRTWISMSVILFFASRLNHRIICNPLKAIAIMQIWKISWKENSLQ